MKRLLCLFLSMILLFSTAPVSAKSKIRLNKTSVSIQKGKTYKLKVKGTKKKVKWSVKNKKIATVSKKGVVKGKKAGTTYVYAKIKGKKKMKCKVKIKNAPKPAATSQTPTSFSLSSTYLKMNLRTSHKLIANFTPKGTSGSIKWESLNPEVASIDANGNVSAKAPGTAIITASYNNMQKLCQVEVVYDYDRDNAYILANTPTNWNLTGNDLTVTGKNNNLHSIRVSILFWVTVQEKPGELTSGDNTIHFESTPNYISIIDEKIVPANSSFSFYKEDIFDEQYLNGNYDIYDLDFSYSVSLP